MPVLSLQTDLALRTLMFLAAHEQRRCQIHEVAEFFGVSKDHLAKAARRLGQEGFVRTIRGIGGGIELAQSPDQISVGEVIRRFEGSLNLLDCTQIENVCRIQPGCRLKGVLQEAERRQLEYLSSVTLSQVVQPGENLVQLTLM